VLHTDGGKLNRLERRAPAVEGGSSQALQAGTDESGMKGNALTHARVMMMEWRVVCPVGRVALGLRIHSCSCRDCDRKTGDTMQRS
jgi:hypothetical protein